MSDKFFTIPGERLFNRILEEEKKGSIFGIPRELFFRPSANDPFRMERYGIILDSPLGVAAGPHTQMAQNIISAWLTGARYIELKTVQTLDELNVSKPCIDMEDEGYNCEWSQELRIKESFREYLTAWVIIHLLRHKFGDFSTSKGNPGFIFNMSVGYNMEGILKENVQWFLNKMENCREEKDQLCESLAALYPSLTDIEIPDRMSDNITLSTMHGCPPKEIETIALYLINERKYHTTIKLNPTLLGPELLREILNKKLGFEVNVPDEAFAHDLKYPDAVRMIETLTKAAESAGVNFGLKLTNTLECLNLRDIFPENEKMMYMSGKPLHPISINLASKLQETFSGSLDISFCAGVDCFNIADVISCGLKPVTVCSDILKPGGYARLSQYLDRLSLAFSDLNAKSIDDFIGAKLGASSKDVKEAAFSRLKKYADEVIDSGVYKKNTFPGMSIKTNRGLGHFDCIQAPCVTTCPTGQDVPAYMYYAAQGDFDAAFEVILEQNPFPAVTGEVCDQSCIGKCTRINYDNPLHIREIKGAISHYHKEEPELIPAPKTGKKAAIIGAGPSGLSCAFFLALAGVEVNVYETRDNPGGMISRVIPLFRLKDELLRKDIKRIEALGVHIHYNSEVDRPFFDQLLKDNDYVYIAVGARESTPMNIEGEELPGVMDALTFLTRIRNNEVIKIESKVAIVGGGNSAMDAARAARRLVKGPDSEVAILYRRSRNEMPAIKEEIEAALKENIVIKELTTPVRIDQENCGLKVHCWKMKLGEKDNSGRRRPVKIENSDFHMCFDAVIIAIGQIVELDFLRGRQWEPVQENGLTAIENVFIGGDALRGPSSIITAAADGKKVALSILNSIKNQSLPDGVNSATVLSRRKSANITEYAEKNYLKKPLRRFSSINDCAAFTEDMAMKEAERCLSCSEICNVCVTVCPNRANVSFEVVPKTYPLQKAVFHDGKIEITEDVPFCLSQKHQVYNIADFCNECGNCWTFCPSNGAPYKDKPKLCLTEESFSEEPAGFWVGTSEGLPIIKSKTKSGSSEQLVLDNDHYLYITPMINATLDKNTFEIKNIELNKNSTGSFEIRFQSALEMSILLNGFS